MKPHSLLLLAALAASVGCTSVPAAHWLSLPLPLASATHEHGQATPQRVLIVRRAGIPEYLQTDKVRYRQADSLLGEWADTFWADRLEVGLTDHLVMRLRLALPGWTVCERLCPAQTSPIVLTVDFAPMDYVRDKGQLQADAHWTLIGHGRHGRTVVAAPVHPDSAEGQAAALAQVLDRLTSDIAMALRIGP